MSTIWIVQNPGLTAPSLASALIGDFAVRAVASLTTLRMLARIRRRAWPDLILIHAGSLDGQSPDSALRDVRDLFKGVPCLVQGDLTANSHDSRASEGERNQGPSGGLDNLGLSVLIDGILARQSDTGPGAGQIRYRDFLLNFSRLELVSTASDDKVTLPLKEAQLLRVLLSRPGTCVTREELKASVWADVKVSPRTVDSHVSRLRHRLREIGVTIESKYGGGYILT